MSLFLTLDCTPDSASRLAPLAAEMRRVGCEGLRGWFSERFPNRVTIWDYCDERGYGCGIERLREELERETGGVGRDAVLNAVQRAKK